MTRTSLSECITLLLSPIWCYSAGPSCPDGEWGCLDGSKCIAEENVCDGRAHRLGPDYCSDLSVCSVELHGWVLEMSGLVAVYRGKLGV